MEIYHIKDSKRTAAGVSTVASYPISFGSHFIVRADLKIINDVKKIK